MMTGQPPRVGSPAAHRHHHRHAHVRRVYWSPVKGTRESLLRQNERVDQDGLERIEDDEQLADLEQSRALVELPVSDATQVSGKLPQDRRYCRPWTREFVEDFGKDYFTAWRQPIQVTSAVRTVQVQKKLRRHNRNAAPISGEDSSPHMTGAAIDIAKAGMGREQLNWVRNYLLQKQSTGNIDVEEEFRQRVFHIAVYKSYSDSKLTLPVKEVQTAEPLPAPEGIEH